MRKDVADLNAAFAVLFELKRTRQSDAGLAFRLQVLERIEIVGTYSKQAATSGQRMARTILCGGISGLSVLGRCTPYNPASASFNHRDH